MKVENLLAKAKYEAICDNAKTMFHALCDTEYEMFDFIDRRAEADRDNRIILAEEDEDEIKKAIKTYDKIYSRAYKAYQKFVEKAKTGYKVICDKVLVEYEATYHDKKNLDCTQAEYGVIEQAQAEYKKKCEEAYKKYKKAQEEIRLIYIENLDEADLKFQDAESRYLDFDTRTAASYKIKRKKMWKKAQKKYLELEEAARTECNMLIQAALKKYEEALTNVSRETI